jgi:hypothetical protein
MRGIPEIIRYYLVDRKKDLMYVRKIALAMNNEKLYAEVSKRLDELAFLS